MDELQNKKHENITTDDKILGEMCYFYEHLYNTKNVNNLDIENYLESSNIKTRSTTAKDNKVPTLDECKDTVMSMKSNKAPGLDGLPVEFYKCFWINYLHLFLIC